MKEETKDKIIMILIIIIFILTGVIGYLCYSEDREKPIENAEKKNDFKNNNDLVAKLLDSGYIKKEESTSQIFIEIKNDKVKVKDFESDKMVEAKGISGTPKIVSYISPVASTNTTYIVLTEEGNLYTSDIELIDNDEDSSTIKINPFTKVNTKKVLNIYKLSDKSVKCLYKEKDYSYSIFVEYEDNSLIAYTQTTDNNKLSSKFTKSFNEMFPTLTTTCK